MKQQYSLTSIWYWSLNSVAFIVATFGTVQSVLPNFQPASPAKAPSEPGKEAFNLSFIPYKPNNLNKSKFKLSLLPLPNTEAQKCQVFSCLPPNPFHNNDDVPELDLQQDNYKYTASNINPYKLDKLKINIISPLSKTEVFIPTTTIQEKSKPTTPQQSKPQTITSGIFSHTYESASFPQTQLAKKITLGDAVYLTLGQALGNSALPSAIINKTPTVEPNYTWNERNDNSNIALKLSLIKNADAKIARLNQLINKQDARNALNSKITDAILAYRKFQQAQEKVKIIEDTLNIVKTKVPINLTNHRIAVLTAKNQLEARRLELSSILGLDKTAQIVASDISVIKPIPLDFHKLQQIALNNQPNYLSNQLQLELSKLKQTKETETVSQLDSQLQNSIRDINLIYTQLEGARKNTKLLQQSVDTEDNINNLTNARKLELDLTIKYLSALTSLDLLLGTTLDTWQISIQ
jgi:hypothetical protein